MESIGDTASNVLIEGFDELTGLSKRKWALILLAFLLGSAVTAVVVIRLRQHSGEKVGPVEVDAATPSGPQTSASAWSRGRARIARTDAAMRARVGRAGDRLNPRRRAPGDEVVDSSDSVDIRTDAELDPTVPRG